MGICSSLASIHGNRLHPVDCSANDLQSGKLRPDECFPAIGELANYLGRRHEFLYHRAKIAGLPEIEKNGLVPLVQPPAIDTDLELLRHETGESCPKLICFASKPKAYSIKLPDKEPRVMLRVRSADILKNRLALDWTWDGCWTHAIQIRRKRPAISPTELFLWVFEDLGSLACLGPVPSQFLWIQINQTTSIKDAQFMPLKDFSARRELARAAEEMMPTENPPIRRILRFLAQTARMRKSGSRPLSKSLS